MPAKTRKQAKFKDFFLDLIKKTKSAIKGWKREKSKIKIEGPLTGMKHWKPGKSQKSKNDETEPI